MTSRTMVSLVCSRDLGLLWLPSFARPTRPLESERHLAEIQQDQGADLAAVVWLTRSVKIGLFAHVGMLALQSAGLSLFVFSPVSLP